jgi:hypothetical protein
MWSTVDYTPLGAIHCVSSIGSLAFMGSSHIVLAGVFNHGVLAYDCIVGKHIRTITTHKYAIWGVVFGAFEAG